MIDRDPEAEAEDKVEEEKLPGVDEDGPAAIESGFVQSAGGDWEAPAASFAGANAGASTGNWDAAPAGETADWAAASAGQPAGEWANEAAKETQW